MSHWVPETGPVSRCPEPSRINARISFAQYWRGHDPQRLYLAPSVPLWSYFRSHCKLCPAASTCDITPRDKTSHSSDWLSLQPVSLCIVDGRDTIRLHRDSTGLKFGCWYRIRWKLKSVEHQQRINTSCLCVFQYYCLLFDCVFFNDFVTFLCIFVSDQLLLVFFSKTSTVLQWEPLCLVGILFVWCNIRPSLIWLVGWNLWPLCLPGDKGKHCVNEEVNFFFFFYLSLLCMFLMECRLWVYTVFCLCFRCQSLNYCGQKYFLIKTFFYNVCDSKPICKKLLGH